MGDLIQCNIKGLKTVALRENKIELICKILTNTKTNILNLQETRLKNKKEIPKKWLNFQHLFHILLCNATEEDPGSGILIFIRKTYEILENNTVIPGRLFHIKLKNLISEEEMNFVSFYGKSNIGNFSAKQILDKFETCLNNITNQNLIICGDFNYVTSIIDRNSSKFTNTDNSYRTEWEKIEIKYNLIDIFRHNYPKRRLYTFSQLGGTSKSRIDRFYISAELVGRISKIKYENNTESDHKFVYLCLQPKITTGFGNWMMNNALLSDREYIVLIRNLIQKYNNNNNFRSKKIAWDFMKMEIKFTTIEFSKNKKRNENREILKIKKEIEIIESLSKDLLEKKLNQR